MRTTTAAITTSAIESLPYLESKVFTCLLQKKNECRGMPDGTFQPETLNIDGFRAEMERCVSCPVQALFHDLNGDGLPDIMVSSDGRRRSSSSRNSSSSGSKTEELVPIGRTLSASFPPLLS